ncbi:MAG: peroxiredoxin-like family protein [Sphingobacteriaceae bacterium]|nr:peroxiredoxin-like family protein [Sphingobacteriaceae bacterium]
MTKSFLFIMLLCLSTFTQAQYKTESQTAGLAVGSQVTPFTALNQLGDKVSLTEALADGPVLLVFYRGQWCPYCNRHLNNLQDSLELLEAKGIRVYAISPEKPEFLLQMQEKTKASFTFLWDEGHKIGKAFDVSHQPEAGTRKKYNTLLRARLATASGDDSEQLPVPATYLISREGVVLWRHFDQDYRHRSSVAAILEQLTE